MEKNKLTWVLQSNAVGQRDLDSLTECILHLGHEVELLRIIPFIHKPADQLPVVDGPCIVYGSSGLVKLGREAEWLPCGWDGDAFELDAMNRSLEDMALNSGATKTVWSRTYDVAALNRWKTVFVRPASETKEFPGRVMEIEQLRDWLEQLKNAGYFESSDNPAIIGPALTLGSEWRVFVVDRRLVCGCQYANAGIPLSRPGMPNEVANFVEQSLQLYEPAPCFVIDVAEILKDGVKSLKIVEYNSINSAGFYACDIARIVDQLSKFAVSNYDR